MQTVDIHTHKKQKGISIRNIPAQNYSEFNENGFISVGLHPWDIEKFNTKETWSKLEAASRDNRVIAIGECGLDRITDTDFNQQEEIFRKQIELAELVQKPIIIHSVKSHPDLIRIRKEMRSSIPWIIHGYRGNRFDTEQLITHDFYFSIGEAIFKSDKLQQVAKEIPMEKLFFETDVSDCTIEEIYSFAANYLNIESELLVEAVYNNFKRVFNDPLAGAN